MASGSAENLDLWKGWKGGDRSALDRALAEELPWVEELAHRRLGALLRAREETGDVVQKTMIELLRYAPHAVIESRGQLRGLLLRMVENVLRGDSDRFRAYKRAVDRERPLPTGEGVLTDGVHGSSEGPSRQAEVAEDQAHVRLALEWIETEDREIILERDWEAKPFHKIGEDRGISEEAARKRHSRALAQLARALLSLRRGKLPTGDGPTQI